MKILKRIFRDSILALLLSLAYWLVTILTIANNGEMQVFRYMGF